ncbi:complement C1q domain-containing protein [Emticicia fontis]
MKTNTYFFFITLLISQLCAGQVTTLPNSIGIGANTLPSIPLHINATSEVARFQGTTPYISMYDGIMINGYIQAINNSFEIGSKNNYDINFYTGDAQRLNINGTNGIVTVNQKLVAQNGIKLTGPLQAAGESVGAEGMVLVSKGNATPAWEERRIGFAAYLSNNITLTTGIEAVITGLTEHFDDGFNFNPSTGEFTVPLDGVYHFDVNTYFLSTSDLSNKPVRVSMHNHGTLLYQYIYLVGFSSTFTTGTSSAFTAKLNAGDLITFRVTQASGINQTLLNYSSTITIAGYKVY